MKHKTLWNFGLSDFNSPENYNIKLLESSVINAR